MIQADPRTGAHDWLANDCFGPGRFYSVPRLRQVGRRHEYRTVFARHQGTSFAMPDARSEAMELWKSRWAGHSGVEWMEAMFRKHRQCE